MLMLFAAASPRPFKNASAPDEGLSLDVSKKLVPDVVRQAVLGGEPNLLWVGQTDCPLANRALLMGAAVNQLGRAEAGTGVVLGGVDALDVPAAAPAQAGLFTEAVETARRVPDLSPRACNPGLAARIGDRLALYGAGGPSYRKGARVL